MLYGYARISRKEQNIERQIRNIKTEYSNAKIYQEAYTGTKLDRPGWTKLYRQIKTGDTVIFDSVSRMSRDAADGYTIYEELYSKGVTLVFLKEPHINTDTYKAALSGGVPMTGTDVDYILDGVNKYLLALAKEQIRLAFEQAEKEVKDLQQRTREGLITAKLNGVTLGQREGAKLNVKKAAEAKQIIKKHSKSFGGTLSDEEIMKQAGISHNTLYKYKRELKEAGAAD